MDNSLINNGQAHLLEGLNSLPSTERSSFLNSFKQSELDLSAHVIDLQKKSLSTNVSALDRNLCLSLPNCSEEQKSDLYNTGLESIARGEVAVVIMAGGMGTRLGFEHPKGMYSIDLPSKKSLFQIFAEKVLGLCRLANVDSSKLPLCIMTSQLNHDETSTLPCFTFDGKIILEKPGVIARSPDGNGGLFNALHSSGVLSKLQESGTEGIFVMGVDNILALPAEPHFIGYCKKQNVSVANFCIEKTNPSESVGVVGLNDTGKGPMPHVVEYTELSKEQQNMRHADGSLVFNAANIATHYFSLSMVAKVAVGDLPLPFHLAKKKIPFGILLPSKQLYQQNQMV
ncbi:hypothetical protein GEMRC1_007493 [Eukaryota sp. GEM-RC1]